MVSERPIPANAGETLCSAGQAMPMRAYPRERGGNFGDGHIVSPVWGLSPRTRGKHIGLCFPSSYCGPIPANAGETAHPGRTSPDTRAYPRERGGNRAGALSGKALKGLSPRTRGKLYASPPGASSSGPIPANAGETDMNRFTMSFERAYPRERGGNQVLAPVRRPVWGLSPRTRGKRLNYSYLPLL